MSYIYYNRNPVGTIKNDCVCRAISLAVNENYYVVDHLLRDNSNINSCDKLTKSCYRELLENYYGLIPRYGNGMTVQEVARMYPHNRVIMRVYAHLTCSINGKVYDIFDCSKDVVDEFWVVE